MDELRPGLSGRAVGRVFGVNGWTVQCVQKKEEETHLSACASSLERADVTAAVHEGAEGKMEEQLHWRIRDMLTPLFFVCVLVFLCSGKRVVMRLKPKKMYGHLTQGRGSVKLFSASALLYRKPACHLLFIRKCILDEVSLNRNTHKTM